MTIYEGKSIQVEVYVGLESNSNLKLKSQLFKGGLSIINLHCDNVYLKNEKENERCGPRQQNDFVEINKDMKSEERKEAESHILNVSYL